ncbi:unnamed protein product [Microthlaspi erraticum]|uniref:Uncharacterized protein n=1 Tax=Microthlaspi erraticum TaxID=1685480 RepID=A0A6D2L1E4_9BRAS|nr:unnamed protein product [Microthlaspi erraticum]
MGIFSSDPERSTSEILNTQESKPSNVIGSSVLDRDSAAVETPTSASSLLHSSSPVRFGTLTPPAPSATTTSAFGSTKAPTFGSCGFAAPTTSTYWSIQASAFDSNAFSAPTPSIFASTEPPAFGSSPFAAPTTSPFGSAKASPFGSGPFDAPTPSPFGSTTFVSAKASPFGSNPFAAPISGATPTSSTSYTFHGSSLFGSVPAVTSVTSAPTQPLAPTSFGHSAFSVPKGSRFESRPAPVQTSASFSFGPAQYCGKNASGNGWSSQHGTEQSSKHPPRYAPTLDGEGGIYVSVSATNSHPHKSHEELRWEDYKRGNKGVSSPASFSFGPAQDCGKTASGSKVFASNGWSSRHGTDGEEIYVSVSATNAYPHKSHEELRWEDYQKGNKGSGVSSPAFGCTACGAMSSSSVSAYLTFNGAMIPPSAATSLSGFFFSTSGSCPMMFGTTNLAAQGTTTTTSAPLQAYPVHGFVFLPASAMNTLQ